jgi:hypothetical protein
MRHVIGVAHQQLQRVGAGCQIENGLGLPGPEVQMIPVIVTPAGATPMFRAPNHTFTLPARNV